VAFGSRLIVLLVLLAALPSCTKVNARTPDPDPGLATPVPPERVIVPVVLPEPVEPPPPPAPTPPAPVDPRQTVRRERPTPPATPPQAAAPETPPPSSTSVLQTTLNPGELEQQATTLINVAKKDLERVPLQQLNASAREQYDRAQGFIRQAQAALNIKNVAVAKELADKAASLASQLPKR
jgi:hypothetical protein